MRSFIVEMFRLSNSSSRVLRHTFLLLFLFTEAPKVDLSKLAGKEIRVRAGEPIKVELPVTGSPVPLVSWAKDNKNLPPSDRVRN
jgi:hypothetical protein